MTAWPRFVAVTGTDTEVGKTVVTAALAAAAIARGGRVAVVKPAQTGVLPDEPGDLAEVRRLAGDVATFEGVRLPEPLAPDVAARRTGATLPSVEDQRALVARAGEGADLVLIEGAGGVLVRVGADYTLIDLLAPLEAGWVVVARAGLGTLNHTQLTVEALRARGQQVLGVVVGSWPSEPGIAEQENLDDLPRLTGVPLLGRVPADAAALSPHDFRTAAPTWLP